MPPTVIDAIHKQRIRDWIGRERRNPILDCLSSDSAYRAGHKAALDRLEAFLGSSHTT